MNPLSARHNAPAPDIHKMAERFRGFSVVAAGISPIYARLAAAAADNEGLLRLTAQATPGQRRPTLLFACVRYLAEGESDETLSAVYGGASDMDPWPVFKEFCDRRAGELLALMRTRRTQTNEVGRSAGLVAVWSHLGWDPRGPFGLVELGASAGLNLYPDRYSYQFGSGGSVAGIDPAAVLHCELYGPGAAEFAATVPYPRWRVGIDIEPLDAADGDTERWLVACLWPEQRERADRLRTALAVARQGNAQMVTGDALDALADVVSALPAGERVCLVTTSMLSYLSEQRRDELGALVASLSTKHEISWISEEYAGICPGVPVPPTATTAPNPDSAVVLGLVRHTDGVPRGEALGWMHPHGEWIEWLKK